MRMLTTLNGMFAKPKPHKIDYIKENKRKLKQISNMVYQNKSKVDVTKTKSSQTEIKRSVSGSSTALKENKIVTSSSCRLTANGSMAVFLHEKKERGNISSISLSAKQKSSQRVNMLKNQSCQTIDPRRCDQLYHDGIIKYPSNKVLQEIAEVEKQKANRLDAHIKKEYFRRNKVRQKIAKKREISKFSLKQTGKGDEAEEIHATSSEEEVEEEKEKEEEKKKEEIENEKEEKEDSAAEKTTRSSPEPVMRAAEIIRKTTEDINYSPNNKGDSKFIKKTTKKSTRESEVLKTVLDPQCPPGHIPLPDSERKKTLHMLRISHAELVREMNLLPVRTDTLRVRQKKIQLENQLNKIEEGIKVFNKSKVYVKIEEE